MLQNNITYLLVFAALLLLMTGLFLAGRYSGPKPKIIPLLTSLSWLTLAFGLWGQTIGLIETFNIIGRLGDITFQSMRQPLQNAFFKTFIGLVIFSIARIQIYILKKRKNYG